MRRIVRAAYLGEKLGDTSALENRRRWTKSSAQPHVGRFGRAITPLSAVLGRARTPVRAAGVQAACTPRAQAADCPPYFCFCRRASIQ